MLIDLNKQELEALISYINPEPRENAGNGPNHLPVGHPLSAVLVRLLTLKDLFRAEFEARGALEYVEREGKKLRREE